MRFIVLISALLMTIPSFAAAQQKVKSLSLPSGAVASSVKCRSNSDKCMRAAGKHCKDGPYQVIDSESHAGGLVADIMPGPFVWYSLTFQCGASDGAIPTFAHEGPGVVPANELFPKTTRVIITN